MLVPIPWLVSCRLHSCPYLQNLSLIFLSHLFLIAKKNPKPKELPRCNPNITLLGDERSSQPNEGRGWGPGYHPHLGASILPSSPPPAAFPTRWHRELARLRARDIFLMVPLPAPLAALLACQLAAAGPRACRQLGRGFMGMRGLGALRTGGRASLAPTAGLPGGSGVLSGSPCRIRGEGMQEAVMGEFLVPRACS